METDDNVIARLLRQEYYALEEETHAAVEGQASLLVAERRQGPVGEVQLLFEKETMRLVEETFPGVLASAAPDRE